MNPAKGMTDLRPMEIIGGGLAGLSLGIALRREGVPVTLHEAGVYPRHRVCGEFITGLASRTIDRLRLHGPLAGALEHREVAWFIDQTLTRINQLPAPALGLSRYTLDARLAREFVSLGGDLRTRSRFTSNSTNIGRVFTTGRRRAPHSRWVGLKFHVRNLDLLRELELHLGNESYVGLARIENEAVNVCGLFRRRPLSARGPELLCAYLRATHLASLADRLERAAIDAASFCAVAAVEFDRNWRVSDRLQLGDAGAMIPPFTGNGMAMAFQSAELALDPLVAFARGKLNWIDACRATQAALRGQFRLRLASAHALHPFLLRPHRQTWLARLNRARLLPFGPLYATLH